MAEVGIKELLEAGVHFGHQTRRWNPKMRRFIHGERGGIYIIDLLKTQALLEQAQRFAGEIAHRGGTVLFVGTKKQARDGVKEIATAAGMPYVNHRWLGGLLTNYQTMSARIKRLHDLERYQAEGQLALLPTRERLSAEADLVKLQANLGGVKNMQRVPDAMFVIDLKTEAIAVREAQRLRIPIIGLVDTNCDPDGIDYVIPGNDDAIRACTLITHAIGDVVQQGRARFRTEEEQARAEAAAQAAARGRGARPPRGRGARRRRGRRARRRRGGADAGRRGRAARRRRGAGRRGRAGRRAQAAGTASAEAAAARPAADEPAVPAAGSPGPSRGRASLEAPRASARPREGPGVSRSRSPPRPPTPRRQEAAEAERADAGGRGARARARAPVAEEAGRAAPAEPAGDVTADRGRGAADARGRERRPTRQRNRSDRSHHLRQAGQASSATRRARA